MDGNDNDSVSWEFGVDASARAGFVRKDRLAGLVVKASASGAEDPGFESRLRRDFPGRVIPVT